MLDINFSVIFNKSLNAELIVLLTGTKVAAISVNTGDDPATFWFEQIVKKIVKISLTGFCCSVKQQAFYNMFYKKHV